MRGVWVVRSLCWGRMCVCWGWGGEARMMPLVATVRAVDISEFNDDHCTAMDPYGQPFGFAAITTTSPHTLLHSLCFHLICTQLSQRLSLRLSIGPNPRVDACMQLILPIFSGCVWSQLPATMRNTSIPAECMYLPLGSNCTAQCAAGYSPGSKGTLQLSCVNASGAPSWQVKASTCGTGVCICVTRI